MALVYNPEPKVPKQPLKYGKLCDHFNSQMLVGKRQSCDSARAPMGVFPRSYVRCCGTSTTGIVTRRQSRQVISSVSLSASRYTAQNRPAARRCRCRAYCKWPSRKSIADPSRLSSNGLRWYQSRCASPPTWTFSAVDITSDGGYSQPNPKRLPLCFLHTRRDGKHAARPRANQSTAACAASLPQATTRMVGGTR